MTTLLSRGIEGVWRAALADVSLRLGAGEAPAVVGENGAGSPPS